MGVTIDRNVPEIIYDLSDLTTILNFTYDWLGNYTPPLGYESFFQHYSQVVVSYAVNDGSPYNIYTGSRGYVEVDLSGGFTNPGWVDSTSEANTENGVAQPESKNLLEPLTYSFLPLIPHVLTLSGAAHGFLAPHTYNFSQRRTAEIRGVIRSARVQEILALYPNATITFQISFQVDQTYAFDVHLGSFVIERILSTQTTTLPETTFDVTDLVQTTSPITPEQIGGASTIEQSCIDNASFERECLTVGQMSKSVIV